MKFQALARVLMKRRLGLHVTWPTSYEALVGRANLKSGWLMIVSLIFPLLTAGHHVQVNGYWLQLPQEVSEWLLFNWEKVRGVLFLTSPPT